MTATKKRRPIQPLTLEEINRLLHACRNMVHPFRGERAYSMIVFIWRTQVRISEALSMEVNDLDLDRGTARVQCGKGGKYRVVGFDDYCLIALNAWIETRKKYRLGDCPVLFPTSSGTTQTPHHFRRMMREFGRRAGITKRCHPHGLRHTGAIELRDEGIPLHHIQQQLGHSQISTTAHYLKTLYPAAAIAAMRQRSM